MRKLMMIWVVAAAGALAMGGCPGAGPNAFQTFTEVFGTTLGDDDDGSGSGGGADDGDAESFRRVMSLTVANVHPFAELNVSMMAWVLPSSLRTADQQDALLRNGYVQLSRETAVGEAFRLPAGTFVYNGPGTAGSTPILLEPTRVQQDDGTGVVDPTQATTRVFNIIAPDAILLFQQPPVSCESVAFSFTIEGDPLSSEFAGLNIFAGPESEFSGLKSLNYVEGYQCFPLRPGYFLRQGGGQLEPNEFRENQDLRVDFSPIPSAEGYFATVTLIDS